MKDRDHREPILRHLHLHRYHSLHNHHYHHRIIITCNLEDQYNLLGERNIERSPKMNMKMYDFYNKNIILHTIIFFQIYPHMKQFGIGSTGVGKEVCRPPFAQDHSINFIRGGLVILKVRYKFLYRCRFCMLRVRHEITSDTEMTLPILLSLLVIAEVS